jgi:hypothetical protein
LYGFFRSEEQQTTNFPLVNEWCSGSGTLSRAFLEHPDGIFSKGILLDSKPFLFDHIEQFQQKIEFHHIELLYSKVKKLYYKEEKAHMFPLRLDSNYTFLHLSCPCLNRYKPQVDKENEML